MYKFSNGGESFIAAPFDRSIALLRWCSFWAAVFLPLVHVPLLVVSGLTSASVPALLALWVANAVALVLGRQHSPHGRPAFAGGDRR